MQTVFRYPLTQAHIDAGERGDCTECPIALALYEGDRSIESAIVDVNSVHILYPGDEESNLQPTEDVANFIEKFDGKRGVRPGTLILDFDKETLDYEETSA